jgi:3-isopropylmalate/(R)-2-methylmalate dehydratase large subunit
MPRRKIPTKAELIQLQKLYKTDEKIAERLGNVTPQLVAYWRRKKNVPKYSFAKFSREEIKELWERFGDDYRCGLELGISKAAFYNWRRRYGLKDKPAFLKLEQLELNLGGPSSKSGRKKYAGHQTISLKILAERAGMERVEVGQVVEVEPDLAMSHDNAGEVLRFFNDLGLNYVWNPNRIVIPLDYQSLPADSGAATTHKNIRDFVRRQNIKYFYEAGEGYCHQVIIEKSHILPGQLAFGTNGYSTSYGCLGAFGTGISTMEMAAVWATGKLWLQVPSTLKIIINGKLPPAVCAKDVILFVARKLGTDMAAYRALEFYGTTISQMSISERFTIANLARELGAKAAIIPFDSVTRRYLLRRTNMPYRPALADRDAIYEATYEFNIDQLVPQVACPQSFDNIVPVGEREGVPVDQVIIGCDSNGRFDDLRIAADIVKGKKINSRIRLLIYPGSRTIYLEALKKGLIRAFVEAGAIVMNPGSAPGQGNQMGSLASGERCVTTFSRNRKGGMIPDDAEEYLVSPATAAATALKGTIIDPAGYIK